MLCVSASNPLQPSPSTAAQRKEKWRFTRVDNRYQSGVFFVAFLIKLSICQTVPCSELN